MIDAEIEGCVLQMEKEHKPRNTSQTDAERGKATRPRHFFWKITNFIYNNVILFLRFYVTCVDLNFKNTTSVPSQRNKNSR